MRDGDDVGQQHLDHHGPATNLTRRNIYGYVASALDALEHDAPIDAGVVLRELQETLEREGVE